MAIRYSRHSAQSEVLSQVRHAIETHGLLCQGDGVIVGVSGGPDSLCLLHVLLQLQEALDLRLHVAHLNHGARGAEADEDAEFVAALTAQWGLPVTLESHDVPALARRHKLAFEEAARRARYGFLARVAEKQKAASIAVGHNADDQTETVLMHLMRGAGPAGLRGMQPRTRMTDYRLINEVAGQPVDYAVTLIRPLLDVSREAIEGYCADQGLAPRFDRSNLDTTYFRNRLRHELLPLLETYNPNIRARLRHTATIVAADYEVLSGLREKAWREIVCEQGPTAITFKRAAWQALPVALQRSTLRQAAFCLRRSLRDVDFGHVEAARQVGLHAETGAQAILPMGLAVAVSYDTLRVSDVGDVGPPPDEPLLWEDEPLPVALPGSTPLPHATWTLRGELVRAQDAGAGTGDDPWEAILDADRITGPLSLRGRRRGDRFQPQGMAGHTMKLSAFMTNVKIPRAWRDHVPLLTSGDQIVWVCGRRVDERAATSTDTQRIARLRFERTV